MEINETERWVYVYDKNYPTEYEFTNVRYILGEKFDKAKQKALVCIGINPSTAVPEDLDATLKRVKNHAIQNGYGAWYMLNVYPQRATNPDNMDKECNEDIHAKNVENIEKLFEKLPSADIWCAWGSNINKRTYLKYCLKQIAEKIQSFENKDFKYFKKEISDTTRNTEPEHPLHPIASIKTKGLQVFDLKKYLETIFNNMNEQI